MHTNKPQKTYQRQFDQAIADFWGVRSEQSEKQKAEGKQDAGTRGTVTGGKHLGPLEDLVVEVLKENGFDSSSVSFDADAALPGYFRPQKRWDIVVRHGENVVATMEFKSQVGSFGNNFNNRIEEAIGQTVDFWKAYENNLIPGLRPWFGYFMLIEDHPKSRSAVKKKKSLFDIDSVFEESSYIERYQIAFDRLIKEGNLDAACFATSVKGSEVGRFPSKAMSFDYFALALSNRCQEAIAALGPLPTHRV